VPFGPSEDIVAKAALRPKRFCARFAVNQSAVRVRTIHPRMRAKRRSGEAGLRVHSLPPPPGAASTFTWPLSASSASNPHVTTCSSDTLRVTVAARSMIPCAVHAMRVGKTSRSHARGQPQLAVDRVEDVDLPLAHQADEQGLAAFARARQLGPASRFPADLAAST
jgi:hypothetical protein